MDECSFCAIADGATPSVGGTLFEDEYVLAYHAFEGDEPAYLGNLVVQTKRHTGGGLAEITDDEARAVGLALVCLARALKAVTGAEKVHAYTFGEAFPHLHTFVVARYPDTPREYWRMRVSEWPGAPRGGVADVAALADRLRAHLADG